MRFRRYSKGGVVAEFDDDSDGVVLRTRPHGGLLRTIDGVPCDVIAREHAPDVAVILACISSGLDREDCLVRGVEVAA